MVRDRRAAAMRTEKAHISPARKHDVTGTPLVEEPVCLARANGNPDAILTGSRIDQGRIDKELNETASR